MGPIDSSREQVHDKMERDKWMAFPAAAAATRHGHQEVCVCAGPLRMRRLESLAASKAFSRSPAADRCARFQHLSGRAGSSSLFLKIRNYFSVWNKHWRLIWFEFELLFHRYCHEWHHRTAASAAIGMMDSSHRMDHAMESTQLDKQVGLAVSIISTNHIDYSNPTFRSTRHVLCTLLSTRKK